MATTEKIERKHPLAKCEVCPLYKEPCAPTIGPNDASLAVVSRSPGKYEARKAVPFSGPSGKVLDHLLKQNGVDRKDVLLTNVVLCYTDDPPIEAIEACSMRLQHELGNADTIIAAGSEATRELIGSKTIAGNRGHRHRRIIGASKSKDQEVVVTNNPAVVLRNDKAYVDLVKDFQLAINPKPTPTLPSVSWTNDPKEAKNWLHQILELETERLACDIESGGLSHTAWLASIAFSATGSKAVSFGYRVVNDRVVIRDYLRPLLERESCTYIWHNGKFDIRNLRAKGIKARVDEDTLLMSYALDERSDEEVHSLDYLLMDNFGWPKYGPSIVSKWKSNPYTPVPDELYPYNGLDAAGCYQLYEEFRPRLEKEDVVRPYEQIYLPASEALVTLELAGMNYDVLRAADMNEEEVIPKLNELKLQLQWKVGDGAYNPRSPQQNAALVYDKWCLIPNVVDRPGKERSVDKPVYTAISRGEFVIRGISASSGEILKDQEIQDMRQVVIEWAALLNDYKALATQRSTYIESLIPRAEANNGRIHTDLNIHGSVSRLSSRNPNLQNITRTKAGLPDIRKLFTASPGRVILNADFSQAELRCIAQFSGCPELSKYYYEGISLHKQVARQFYGENYTHEQYVNCKNMDFGVAYGQSAGTFKEKHDVPITEGEQFIKWWKSQFPEVFEWSKEVQREAVANGFVQSPFGRKRRFYLITDQNIGDVKREAVNFLPQSTASDFTIASVIVLVRELDPAWGNVVLTVHDSIVGDIYEDHALEAASLFKQVMEASPKDTIGWDFPFVAEVAIGKSWGEVKEIEV